MTEAEWLTCDNALLLFEQVRKQEAEAIDRRCRLLVCACGRLEKGRMTYSAWVGAIETAEEYADGRRSYGELMDASRAANAANLFPMACDSASIQAGFHLLLGLRFSDRKQDTDGPIQAQAISFLRDIFGNPFRPVRFDPEWCTSTAVALAQQMYESRDFSTMPILADALQDAGCDNADILNHCRDANGVHVRGCWVVDHVLGKE
jgi:hypothetical protein